MPPTVIGPLAADAPDGEGLKQTTPATSRHVIPIAPNMRFPAVYRFHILPPFVESVRGACLVTSIHPSIVFFIHSSRFSNMAPSEVTTPNSVLRAVSPTMTRFRHDQCRPPGPIRYLG